MKAYLTKGGHLEELEGVRRILNNGGIILRQDGLEDELDALRCRAQDMPRRLELGMSAEYLGRVLKTSKS